MDKCCNSTRSISAIRFILGRWWQVTPCPDGEHRISLATASRAVEHNTLDVKREREIHIFIYLYKYFGKKQYDMVDRGEDKKK